MSDGGSGDEGGGGRERKKAMTVDDLEKMLVTDKKRTEKNKTKMRRKSLYQPPPLSVLDPKLAGLISIPGSDGGTEEEEGKENRVTEKDGKYKSSKGSEIYWRAANKFSMRRWGLKYR